MLCRIYSCANACLPNSSIRQSLLFNIKQEYGFVRTTLCLYICLSPDLPMCYTGLMADIPEYSIEERNLPAGPENERMPMLRTPNRSDPVLRDPAREQRPWDNLRLKPRARYAVWEEACLHTFFCVMYLKKVVKPVRKIIIEFFNPYTPGNMLRTKRIHGEKAEFAKHIRMTERIQEEYARKRRGAEQHKLRQFN